MKDKKLLIDSDKCRNVCKTKSISRKTIFLFDDELASVAK